MAGHASFLSMAPKLRERTKEYCSGLAHRKLAGSEGFAEGRDIMMTSARFGPPLSRAPQPHGEGRVQLVLVSVVYTLNILQCVGMSSDWNRRPRSPPARIASSRAEDVLDIVGIKLTCCPRLLGCSCALGCSKLWPFCAVSEIVSYEIEGPWLDQSHA